MFRRLLKASGIRVIFDQASTMEKRGEHVIHLEIGRPDYKMPPGLMDGAKQALDEGFVHYVANRGLLELRQAISEDIQATTGRRCDPETELVVTIGASEGMCMCMLALVGPNDEVIIPEPTWPHYAQAVEMSGATPVSLPLSPEDGFLIDPEAVASKISPRTRMLVVNSPSNPTGAVQTTDRLKPLAQLAEKHGFYVLADEVYRDFIYEDSFCSMAEIMGESDLLILLNSLSKSYVMTGFRVGWVVATPKISDALNRIHQYTTVCGVSFAQKAAATMMSHPERLKYLIELKAEFKKRRQVWQKALANHPNFRLTLPKGAFYLFPRVEYRGMDGMEFCRFMLEKHRVATVPGEVFGADFRHHVRISFGRELDTQIEACSIFKSVLEKGG